MTGCVLDCFLGGSPIMLPRNGFLIKQQIVVFNFVLSCFIQMRYDR